MFVLALKVNLAFSLSMPEPFKKLNLNGICLKMLYLKIKSIKIPLRQHWGGADPILIDSALFSAQERKRLYWSNIPIAALPESNPLVLQDIMISDAPEKDYYNKPYIFHGEDKKVIATIQDNWLDIMKRVYNPAFKCATLTCVSGGHQEKKVWDRGRIRKLSPIEYERLQTLPDGFTEGYSDNVRRTLCGNGWTKEVIKHIFKGLITI